MATLMCKDTPVYAFNAKKILCPPLMPCPEEHLEDWRKSRQFLRGINRAPEEDERQLGKDSVTVKRRLSLSDCYWFRYSKDTDAGSFSELTPYLNEFTEYGVRVSRKSSPSIQLGGSITKVWRKYDNRTVIHKVMLPEQYKAETLSIELAERLELPVNSAVPAEEVGASGLYIINMTSMEDMLMRLHYWDLGVESASKTPSGFGYSLKNVISVYDKLGINADFPLITILFDAVIGNYDRTQNLSNWGYFKSSTTGKHSVAPLYDFNLAHTDQKNMYLHLVKAWLTEEHKVLLRKWKPTVDEHGVPVWQDNLAELLK